MVDKAEMKEPSSDIEALKSDETVRQLMEEFPSLEGELAGDPEKLHRIVQFQQIRETHSGPLPHPRLLAQYEKIHPGFTQKTFESLDNDSARQEKILLNAQDKHFTEADNGRKSAVLIVCAVLVCIFVLAILDKTVVAVALCGVIVALAIAFMLGRHNKSFTPNSRGPSKASDKDEKEE